MRLKDFQAAQLSNEIRVCGDVRDVSPGASVDTVEPPSLRAQPEAAQEEINTKCELGLADRKQVPTKAQKL